ncbi:hypothetical protein MKK70_05985 [Methylobacterium sp. E-041]|uniref:hypothetical protein n=1 Tax=Methylobacterium sp. E-041 TaxID=2836573 RepID=UPI001FBB916A|nr:hypothetical protein [Methylobacterium sp. E-041]MCJ2104937.1 hypothetical protein [Methylobacterium sp. E-041]
MTTRILAGAALTGALALALLAAPAASTAARADTVPNLDIKKTCQSASRANVSVSDNANIEGCLRSERDAKKEAERRWGDYTPSAKRQCEDQYKAGGYPSYVEMVTCLELASGTVPTQANSGGTATGGPGAPGGKAAPQEAGSQNLTREPAASQRTNPIEVLEKK